ncbi:thioredoxin family protein [Brevibacillus brevis]|uniref:Thioredoxin family protein n=1 Tax=Brevibacillus brevis TaxID=1393 RepID=A0ABY9SWM8_BREBE|nr:thioredoxin family protein [Brevibacillus brevis]WNC12219.1 thioredoxin family protein [Brevibacillus brevis]
MQEWKAEEFSRAVEEKLTFVLFIYTPMCGTCKLAERMLSVTLEALPAVNARSININLAPDMARMWEITSVPALLLFREGELIERHYAIQSAAFLFERLKEWF